MHQIRNSLRYIAEKEKKEFIADLKPVYQAVNKEHGFENLIKLDEKWRKSTPYLFNPGIITGTLYQLFLTMTNTFVR